MHLTTLTQDPPGSFSHSQILFTLRKKVSQDQDPNLSAVEHLLNDCAQEVWNTSLPAKRNQAGAYRAKEQDGGNYICNKTSQNDLVVTYESISGDSQVY